MPTMELKNSYHPAIETLQKDIEQYFVGLRSKDDSIRYQFLFSPFYENAEVLILGFNPGMGDKDCTDVMERTALTYTKDDKYPTARDTFYVFGKAGLENVLEGRIVKSNVFHLATENAAQLYPKANKIDETPKFLFYKKHFEWTRELIQKVAPNLIIIEGITAYFEIKKAIEEKGFGKEIDIIDKAEIFQGKFEIGNRTVPFIGYHRGRYGMKNKDGFAELLREYYQQLSICD